MVERSLSMREVRGSIPRISIAFFFFFSFLFSFFLYIYIYIFLSKWLDIKLTVYITIKKKKNYVSIILCTLNKMLNPLKKLNRYCLFRASSILSH